MEPATTWCLDRVVYLIVSLCKTMQIICVNTMDCHANTMNFH
jgi:uncharacterized membrane protein YuzA (DUF378 family)